MATRRTAILDFRRNSGVNRTEAILNSGAVSRLAEGGAAAKARPESAPLSVDLSLSRSAFGLAIGSLLLAGCLSLLLVVGRIPGLAEWVSDPQFFKRCLVVHVDLALVVWFFALGAGLYSLLPGDRNSHTAFRLGFGIACAGVVAMMGGALVRDTAPVLSNYVPVIDNALFIIGLALFFGGLLNCFFNGRLMVQTRLLQPGPKAGDRKSLRVTADVATGLKAMAVAYILAMTTFFVSWVATPRELDPKSYYELVFWGGGHVLQVANIAGMLAVWLLLLSSILGEPILSQRSAHLLFGLLVIPHAIAPLLTCQGTLGSLYRLGFTRLMQFGIFPVVTIILALCVRRIRAAWCDEQIGSKELRDPRFVGFMASAALTLTGFLVGSAIRNSNTVIPAHYHASIGAVTVAYMAVTYLLFQPLGCVVPSGKWQRVLPWQLFLFGFGQVIFAIGFGFGGLHGLSRKAYGAEQHIRSLGELIGIGIMGFGGLIAVAGGILFLIVTVRASFNRPAPAELSPLLIKSRSNA